MSNRIGGALTLCLAALTLTFATLVVLVACALMLPVRWLVDRDVGRSAANRDLTQH